MNSASNKILIMIKMKRGINFLIAIVAITIIIVSYAFIKGSDFITEQKKFERVRTAYKDKGNLVMENLKGNNIDPNNCNILITAFKSEQELNIYAKNKNATTYKKLNTYNICASSGMLGPKRKAGDNQVPEGFYFIKTFNPTSNFYLSLGLNYPNQADLITCKGVNPGDDIFIHGDCVTIGCLPMTNDKIKEIYIYALLAKQSGQQKIPVYIFPFKFTDSNMKKYGNNNKSNTQLIDFWKNLKTGYDLFQHSQMDLKYTVDKKGDYLFEN